MSKSHLYLKTGFPRAPLQNGVGRYVCQVKRMVIKFCKSSGSSRGVRDFIETDLIKFAEQSPEFVVYVKPRRHHAPYLITEYLNGEKFHMSFCNFNKEEVTKWINLMKTRAGHPIMAYRKNWHTDNPSIQGVWSPFLHQDPVANVTNFPSDHFSKVIQTEKSATELLLEMYEEQKKNLGVDGVAPTQSNERIPDKGETSNQIENGK